MPDWQRIASQIAHWGLYALLFVVPVSGWLMSSADGVRIEWFGLISIPDLLGANDRLEDVFEEVHEACAKALVVLALVHAAAGLKHGFIDRDASLRRISSPLSVGGFLVIVALGIALLV
jgi:cytochrome b561